jgi:hypothetical protein
VCGVPAPQGHKMEMRAWACREGCVHGQSPMASEMVLLQGYVTLKIE